GNDPALRRGGGNATELRLPDCPRPQKRLCSLMLLFHQCEINGPAPADVRAWCAEVVEDGLLGAAGFFQGVGQNGEALRVKVAAGQEALLVGGLSQRDD